MKKIQIVPTVMPDDRDDFKEKINRVYRFVKTIQIDVMDGNFVPSKSWPYNSSNDPYWEDLVSQEEGLPRWEDCDFEIDLMVKDQIGEARNWINAGVSRAIGHIEAFDNDDQVKEFLNLKNEYSVGVFLALAPNTDNEKVEKWIDRIDGVQFMGIEKVGYQGQEFAEKTLEKIKYFREKYPEKYLTIDGGVSFETAEDIIEAGVDALASGSLIFESADVEETIKSLEEITE